MKTETKRSVLNWSAGGVGAWVLLTVPLFQVLGWLLVLGLVWWFWHGIYTDRMAKEQREHKRTLAVRRMADAVKEGDELEHAKWLDIFVNDLDGDVDTLPRDAHYQRAKRVVGEPIDFGAGLALCLRMDNVPDTWTEEAIAIEHRELVTRLDRAQDRRDIIREARRPA